MGNYGSYSAKVSRNAIVAEETIRLVLSVIIFSLNIAQVVLISRIRRKKTVYELFLVSLAISDALFVAFIMVISVTILAKVYSWFAFATLFSFISVKISIFHLLAIAVDRVFSVFLPVKRKMYFTLSSAKKVILGIWTITGTAFTILLILRLQIEQIVFQIHSPNVLSSIIYSSSTLYGIMYGSVVFKLIRKSRSKIQKSKYSRRRSTKSSKEKAAVILCVLTTFCFIACTIPLAINLEKQKPDYYSTILFLANAGLNSILFFFRGKIKSYCIARSSQTTTIK